VLSQNLPPPPANLLPSIQGWIEDRLWIASPYETQFDWEQLRAIERSIGVYVPFDPSSADAAIADVRARVEVSEEFAVRLLAILLARVNAGSPAANELAEIFEAPGSKWEVVTGENGPSGITLRHTGPVPDVVQRIMPFSNPASAYLQKAFEKLNRPDPDLVGAYSESIKAVEAAARPVVIPDDPLATLGKIISAMRDKPSKWAVVLGEETVEDVVRRAEIVWQSPHERHGSDDPGPAVTLEQAQAAFDLALGLTDYFARGLIFRSSS
jgi:hypothetical protein